MSWSVSATGKPGPVKAALAKQFGYAKEGTAHIQHESDSVVEIEHAVNLNLDFMIEHAPQVPISVEAGGSASVAPENAAWPSTTQLSLTIRPIHGFIE